MAELEGKVLDGKYRLTRRLGSGGVGTVYEAVHELIGQKFALKVLKPEYATSPTLAQRLVQEAKAASAVDHPSIIKIFDAGRTRDGLTFLVMELLVGQELSARIRGSADPVPFQEAVDITSDVLDALVAAHAKGIIHRDLKPENVFLTRGPHGQRWVKLLDFGIAKIVDHRMAGPRLTHAGTVVGTPFYMAPEHARGARDLDARVDVYATGVMLFEMLTKRVPFDGQSYNEVLAKVLSEPFPRPRKFNGNIPEGLEAVLLRATAKDRNARFPSAAAFLEALTPFCSEAPSAVFRLTEVAAFGRASKVGTEDLEMVPEESIPTLAGEVPLADARPAPSRPPRRDRPEDSPPGEPKPDVARVETVRLPGDASETPEGPPVEREAGTLMGAAVPAPDRTRSRLALWISIGVVAGVASATLIWSSLAGRSGDRTPAAGGPGPVVATDPADGGVAEAASVASADGVPGASAADSGPSIAAVPLVLEAGESPNPVPLDVLAGGPDAGESRLVTIRLLDVPPDAKLWVDGSPSTNPFYIERSDAEHRLRIHAAGFQPFSTTFTAPENMGIPVRLLRARGPGSADAGDARDSRSGQLLPDPHLPR